MSWIRLCGWGTGGFEKVITYLVTILGIDAGVYLTNSTAGAWKAQECKETVVVNGKSAM